MREQLSLIIPNASMHGPPTSSTVLVNLGKSIRPGDRWFSPANRVRSATASDYVISMIGSAGICWQANIKGTSSISPAGYILCRALFLRVANVAGMAASVDGIELP